MHHVSRIEPKLGPDAFKTYQIVAPLKSHWRKASCEEVQCQSFARGFKSVIDTSTSLGQQQARYIENVSARVFGKTQEGSMITYVFPAGQACFTQHRRPLEREPFYVVRDGDHRGNPRGTRPVQRRAAEWVDDFAEHQQGLADRMNRG